MLNMFGTTGTSSFIMYAFFIFLGIIALWKGISLIKNEKIDSAKLDKIIDLFKYMIVSVALATVTLIVSDLFREREQTVRELEYFDKYTNDIKSIDKIRERYQLVRYLSTVAPNGAMKECWKAYFDSVKVDYRNYLAIVAEKQKLDSSKKLTPDQEARRDALVDQQSQLDAPLVTMRHGDVSKASYYESLGFSSIEKGDLLTAINAFTMSENAYHGYHQVFEIARYLKGMRPHLTNKDSPGWKIVRQIIARDYAYGMDESVRVRFLN